jgi:predicted RNA-binding Zn ribbon-like protein
MENTASRIKRFLIPAQPAGLSVDFVNTRYWRGSDTPTETFATMEDVIAWCRDNAGIPASMIDAFRAKHLRNEETALAGAIALRELLFRLYLANAEGVEPEKGDLAALREYLGAAAPRRELSRAGGRYEWAVDGQNCNLFDLLSPVLWSATDLLGGTGIARLKRCANDQCKWLFVDDSKNGSRRWCSMSSCGNRAKAHRHYHGKSD